MHTVSAVIVAGGSSQRMGGRDKIFALLGGQTVLERTVAAFERHAGISEIVVVTARESAERARQLLSHCAKLRGVVPGGETRHLSVLAGISACSADTAYYAIHDAARPLVDGELITRVLDAAAAHGGAAPGCAVTDTLKAVDAGGRVTETVDRSRLVAVETPQVFEAAAYRAAAQDQREAFDDCEIFERAGRTVCIVPGSAANIKITYPGDLARAAALLGGTEMRIGQGYDVHRLAPGRRLVLGGVEILHETGLLGHSDADVLTHAVIDALLGAANLGDIGALFPDSDAAYKDISSLVLLARAVQCLRGAGYEIGNIDATVICEAPRLRPYVARMSECVAAAAGVETAAVSIKATTEEGLGVSGAGKGIAAQACALVYRRADTQPERLYSPEPSAHAKDSPVRTSAAEAAPPDTAL